VTKAWASSAEAVVLDLEDAVTPDAKDDARHLVADLLTHATPKPTLVRVNNPSTASGQRDLQAIADCVGLWGVRLPKLEDPAAVAAARAVVGESCRIECLIESALGVERAFAIASEPAVAAMCVGAVDLAGDLGVEHEGLSWAMSRVVCAARAAGVDQIVAGAYPEYHDDEGLTSSSHHLRALGFTSRSAIHPRQSGLINDAFGPTPAQVAEALATVEAMSVARAKGRGGATVGHLFVDAASLASAERILARVANTDASSADARDRKGSSWPH
jgi:citrate lyase subunit beta/citryl-CoA lyase